MPSPPLYSDEAASKTPLDDEETPEIVSLTTHIESIITSGIHSLNTDTSRLSSIWPSIASDFSTAGFGYEAVSKQDFLANHKEYVKLWPDHHMEVTSMTTTFNSRFTTAKTFANMEVHGGHGVPRGLSRKVVSVFEFKKWEGRWLLAAARSMPGEGTPGLQSDMSPCEHSEIERCRHDHEGHHH